MKMLFASDVHGSADDAVNLVERIKAERPDYVMFLGDFCGYGENLIFGSVFGQITVPYSYICGNCDREDVLKRFGFCPTAYTAVERYGARRVYGSHGHIVNPYRLPPTMEKGDVFVYGHTHVPAIFYMDGITVINCGSMSLPRANGTKTYATIEGDAAYIKNDKGEIIKRGELI